MNRLLVSVGMLAATTVASAQAPEPGDPADAEPVGGAVPPELDDYEEIEEAPPEVSPAKDTVAGHFTLAAAGDWAVPFGKYDSSLGTSRVTGSGPGVSAELGFGVSRTVAVGLWGQYLALGNTGPCPDCSTASIAAGAFLRYHLVQGVRFDPWMSAGAGFRSSSIQRDAGDFSYTGFDLVRLAVGGDWYALDPLAFGPYLELDAGLYTSASGREIGDLAAHFTFLVGARATFDLPGKRAD